MDGFAERLASSTKTRFRFQFRGKLVPGRAFSKPRSHVLRHYSHGMILQYLGIYPYSYPETRPTARAGPFGDLARRVTDTLGRFSRHIFSTIPTAREYVAHAN
eukprot:461432-Pleurochrysis_carterae.AAC.1